MNRTKSEWNQSQLTQLANWEFLKGIPTDPSGLWSEAILPADPTGQLCISQKYTNWPNWEFLKIMPTDQTVVWPLFIIAEYLQLTSVFNFWFYSKEFRTFTSFLVVLNCISNRTRYQLEEFWTFTKFLVILNCTPNRAKWPIWPTEKFSNFHQLTELNCIPYRTNWTNWPNWPTENFST